MSKIRAFIEHTEDCAKYKSLVADCDCGADEMFSELSALEAVAQKARDALNKNRGHFDGCVYFTHRGVCDCGRAALEDALKEALKERPEGMDKFLPIDLYPTDED